MHILCFLKLCIALWYQYSQSYAVKYNFITRTKYLLFMERKSNFLFLCVFIEIAFIFPKMFSFNLQFSLKVNFPCFENKLWQKRKCEEEKCSSTIYQQVFQHQGFLKTYKLLNNFCSGKQHFLQLDLFCFLLLNFLGES